MKLDERALRAAVAAFVGTRPPAEAEALVALITERGLEVRPYGTERVVVLVDGLDWPLFAVRRAWIEDADHGVAGGWSFPEGAVAEP